MVIVIIEIWLDFIFIYFELGLNDYYVYCKDRYDCRGGGVYLVVYMDLILVRRRDLENNDNIEIVMVDIC